MYYHAFDVDNKSQHVQLPANSGELSLCENL